MIDPTGKKSGRGAYLCRLQACWSIALRKEALARALKAGVSPADLKALEHFSASLPAEEVVAPA